VLTAFAPSAIFAGHQVTRPCLSRRGSAKRRKASPVGVRHLAHP
jgi:hypothetical protein